MPLVPLLRASLSLLGLMAHSLRLSRLDLVAGRDRPRRRGRRATRSRRLAPLAGRRIDGLEPPRTGAGPAAAGQGRHRADRAPAWSRVHDVQPDRREPLCRTRGERGRTGGHRHPRLGPGQHDLAVPETPSRRRTQPCSALPDHLGPAGPRPIQGADHGRDLSVQLRLGPRATDRGCRAATRHSPRPQHRAA